MMSATDDLGNIMVKFRFFLLGLIIQVHSLKFYTLVLKSPKNPLFGLKIPNLGEKNPKNQNVYKV